MVAIAKICFQEPRRHATAQRDQRREAKRVRGPAAERRSARRHRLCQGAIQNTSVMTCKLSPSQQRRREARRAPRTRPIAPHHPPRACKRFANSYRTRGGANYGQCSLAFAAAVHYLLAKSMHKYIRPSASHWLRSPEPRGAGALCAGSASKSRWDPRVRDRSVGCRRRRA
jgi:hypothetical protein